MAWRFVSNFGGIVRGPTQDHGSLQADFDGTLDHFDVTCEKGEFSKMKVLLALLAIVAFLVGGLVLMAAKSAIHEIEAYILFLIAAVLMTGSAVLESLFSLRKAIMDAIKYLPK